MKKNIISGIIAGAMTAVTPATAQHVSSADEMIRPYHIQVQEKQLADLRHRILATKWPDPAVAPGLFTTDFASTESYRSSALMLDAYQNNVGTVRNNMGHINGNQPGDPAKLAGVIIKLAASENPPLHLPIGSDAIQNLREKIAFITAEVQEWEPVSVSTDHLPTPGA